MFDLRLRTKEEIKDRIKAAIIEEMNCTNLITQGPPEVWVPKYIEVLATKIHNLCLDEIENRRRF